MEVLRIKLKQNKAHYRKADSVINRLTYPLPPFSTVIGALHNACGYTEYKPMDISIQGKFGSMGSELYVNHCRLRRQEDDRGILIKLDNPGMLSAGYIEVASAMRSTGNSFMQERTIKVSNRKLLSEYQRLKLTNEELTLENRVEIKPTIKSIKDEIRTLKKEVRELKKEKSDEYKEKEVKIKELEKESKDISEEFKGRQNQVKEALDKFVTLTKSPQKYEVLYDVELVLHIKAEDEVLKDILDNINNFVSLGRSEDFIQLEEAKLVEVKNDIDEDDVREVRRLVNDNTAYISKGAYNTELVLKNADTKYKDGVRLRGTKYYLDKNYVVEDNKRMFQKKEVMYVSNYGVSVKKMKRTYVDKDGYILELI